VKNTSVGTCESAIFDAEPLMGKEIFAAFFRVHKAGKENIILSRWGGVEGKRSGD